MHDSSTAFEHALIQAGMSHKSHLLDPLFAIGCHPPVPDCKFLARRMPPEYAVFPMHRRIFVAFCYCDRLRLSRNATAMQSDSPLHSGCGYEILVYKGVPLYGSSSPISKRTIAGR
ncbi:hypothetical protein COMA2_20138 [Candidatus Nitrospira nitrificans]|uniref:Uncharacterized protein n=1 Tax=Candidatus Nitrospira nitrificans TaxID=1742973 RepID=A0A0S4LE83_9BACT|nr:hypothetical protein COMA2_20138 [Candidatus Nitrospira nitrificans]